MFGLGKYWSALKTLLKLKKGVKNMNIKEGYKTTEFWITVIGMAISGYSGVAGFVSPELSVKVVGGAGMVYAIARAIAKFTPSKKDDEFIAKIEAMIKK